MPEEVSTGCDINFTRSKKKSGVNKKWLLHLLKTVQEAELKCQRRMSAGGLAECLSKFSRRSPTQHTDENKNASQGLSIAGPELQTYMVATASREQQAVLGQGIDPASWKFLSCICDSPVQTPVSRRGR